MRAACLAAIVAAGVFLRWRAADHPYISQWDEAYHALVAKNLAAHPLTPTLYEDKVLPADDKEWAKAGVWLHKPPLPLWLMAAAIAAFGEGEAAFRAPAVVLDAAVIVLVLLLARELFGERGKVAGPFAAALYAVNPLMIRLVSGRIPDDTPHVVNAFFITLSVLLFAAAARRGSRRLAAAAGLTVGLGTLCMSAVALLGVAAPLPLLLSRRGTRGAARLLAAAVPGFAAAALSWPLYCLSRWPELWRHESALHVGHLFTALDAHAHSWRWYAEILPVHYGGSAFLAALLAAGSVLFAARTAARERDGGAASVLVWALLPYVFFSLIATKLYAYVCVAVPALCLLAGLLAQALWSARRGPLGRAALACLAAIVVQGLLVGGERLRADYSVCPWNALYDYPSFRRTMTALRGAGGPAVILNVGDSKQPQAMYYSGISAYADEPEPALVRGLLSRGYRVYVVLDGERRGARAVRALSAAGLARSVSYLPVPGPARFDPRHPYES